MSSQAALPLSWPDRYTSESFIVADCNRLAFELVCHPENWKTNILILLGPDFSGKTHLAHIFWKMHEANTDILQTSTKGVDVLDSVDKLITEQPELTENLFHMVNSAMLGQKKILLTMRDAPSTWVKLPDLLSRLQASQQISIDQPDEEMIKAAYKKLFIDRGLIIDNKVLDYLAVRSQRSFGDIQENVRKLDSLSLETGRKVTIPLIQSTEII